MRHMSEPLTPSARFLHDAGTLALLALVLIPLYLLLNHYWQSLILLVIFYGLLSSALAWAGIPVVSCGACQLKSRHGTLCRRSGHRLQDWRDILVRPTRSRVCGRTHTMCRRC